MAIKSKQETIEMPKSTLKEKHFYAVDGCVWSDLSEMASCLGHMDANAFSHHVTSANNDLSNWVKDVLHDRELSKSLTKAANAADAKRIVTERIHAYTKKGTR
jgi:hypothetical protein